MEVRDATVADTERVRAVHEASIRGLGPEAYDREQVDAWARACESADYAAAIDADGGAFLVRETQAERASRGGERRPAGAANADGDDVVGFASLAGDPPDGYRAEVDAEVTGVYVHPSVAREGVGSALYDELEDRTRVSGVDRLGLLASLNAVPFYESHGYERVRALDHEFSASESTGVTGTVVEMAKRL